MMATSQIVLWPVDFYFMSTGVSTPFTSVASRL